MMMIAKATLRESIHDHRCTSDIQRPMTAVELCEAFVAGPCAGIRVVRSCLKSASRCPDLTPLASDNFRPMLAGEAWLSDT